MILESVKDGPLIWPTIEENRVTRTKKYAELSATQKIQADYDLNATNIILQGLPSDIYSLINHHRVAKDLWKRIQLLMQDDLDAYDSDCDTISTAKAVLMAKFSNYGSDVLSEVPHSENTNNDILNKNVQEMMYSEQTHLAIYPENKITSDSNIIPYSQYLREKQNAAVRDTNSSTQQDAMILFVFKQLSNQVTNCNKVNKDNLITNESLSAELERYKDREKESLTTTLNVFKNESKEKEAKNIDKEISLEKKVKELNNIVYKIGQSVQTMHMLTKPQVFYDNNLKQALGFQNPFYLKKVQQISLMLYDGNVIAKETNMISVSDSKDTLMLEDESRSKMLLKQSDPMVLEKKVNNKPVNYAVLNELSEDFGKRFVPQQELSAEQAFWFQMSNPSTNSFDASPVKVDVPSELPMHTMEQAGVLKEIVEQADSLNPLDSVSYFAYYSRFTWVKFLASKDEAPNFIIKFPKMIQVRLNTPVRNICTDNGTEFVNQTLRDYYEEVVISHETSVAQTPQQIGVVESENLGKLQAKADIEPALHEMTPATPSSGLVPNPPPSASFVPPLRHEWDLVFQLVFDEFFSPPDSVASPIPIVEAPAPVESTGSPSLTLVDQDAPLPSTSQSTQQSQSHVIPLSAEEESHDLEELVPPLDKVMVITLKWIYKVKLDELGGILKNKGFSKGMVDPALFIRKEGKDILLVQIYVDGLKISQSPRGIFLNKSKYALESLKKYGMKSCDPMDTLMVEKSKLDEDPQGKAIDPTHYRGMARPTQKHLHAVKRIFQYLRGTINRGLWYSKDSAIAVTTFADVVHAGCQDTS
uniref:Integrase catalytic domain-containing protein n=1 Tax=Tanacetum cinerariifolium TaxID=118510 RepID=A0A6L2M0E9_TANCI|nr:hypothetical protein [Tanacetum cinerariifolium]